MGYKRKKVYGLDPEFGAIFMSNTRTKEECLRKQLFGLPSSHCEFVRKVKAGMVLFLFEYESRRLYGVFEAASDGEVDIVPSAYRFNTSGKTFPAQVQLRYTNVHLYQVRVRRILYCDPLSEHEFSGVIKDNYYDPKRFNFGLSERQVHDLLQLFNLKKVKESDDSSLLTKKNSRGKRHERWRKRESYQANDDTSTKVLLYRTEINSLGHPGKTSAEDEVSLVVTECQVSSGYTDIASEELTAASYSDDPEALNPKYSSPSQIKIPEILNESIVGNDICPTNSSDELGDFIPLSLSSDGENDELELDAGFGNNDRTECDANDLYGCKSLSGLCSPRPFFGGEITELHGTSQEFASINPENDQSAGFIESSRRGISPEAADSQLKMGAVQSKSQTGCHDYCNSDCVDENPRVKGLYCETSQRRSVFSRLNLTSVKTMQEQDNETCARVSKFVYDIMLDLQQKHDSKWKKVKRGEFAETFEEGIHLRKSSVFQRLGERTMDSMPKTL